MARKAAFRYLWVLSLLAGASLACSLFTRVGQEFSSAQETAARVQTDIQTGRDLMGTSQAVATQVMSNPAVQTAQVFATQNGPAVMATAQVFATQYGPSLMATVQAFATQNGPAMIETVQTFATQNGPSLLGTVQTFATQNGPSLVATAQAFATQNGPSLAATAQAFATQYGPSAASTLQALATQAPDLLATARAAATQAGVQPPVTPAADLPIYPGTLHNFTSSAGLVSYQVQADLMSVKLYYERNMRLNGWTKIEKETIATGQQAILVFEKSDRKAIILLTYPVAQNQTAVLINIQAK